jgi:hypothetical protein
MAYIKSAALEETGYVVLDPYNKEIDPKEWLDSSTSTGSPRATPASRPGLGQGRDRVQRLLEPQAAAHRQGRRLDRLADGDRAHPHRACARAGRERRAVPHHRAAAEHVRRLPLQPAPGRQQPSEPGRHRLGRALVLQPHRRQGQLLRPAREPHRPERRDAHRAPRRRGSSSTRSGCGTPPPITATSRATASSRRGSRAPSSTPTSRSTTA